tara:strand:+ start:458 stop:1210 length:753 start_codon:yes stop_codon:yes gene_type:complete
MAFLGDFGEFFLGGATTQDVGRTAGREVDMFFGGTGQRGAALGDNIGATLGKIGEGTADQPNTQPALPTNPGSRSGDKGAQETSQSGTNILTTGGQGQMQQANLGALLPLIQGAGRLLGGRAGQIATGIGAGALALGGSNNNSMKPVLTQSRRNKAKVRQLVNFMGIEGTANFLSQSIGTNVSPNDVVALLLRTFRNDGAFITKAQVRNLRRTTNRFKSLEKQVKEAVSMGTTKRAPVRRTVNRSTSIKI